MVGAQLVAPTCVTEPLGNALVICIHGSGAGDSRAFNFSVFKALEKARHCQDRLVVKSVLKASAP